MTITRYNPLVQMTTRGVKPVMGQHERGEYVSYESHQKEMSRLQSQIDALVEVQKRKILEPIENMLSIELVNMATQATIPVYKVGKIDESVAKAVLERTNYRLMNSGVFSVAERVELDTIAATGGCVSEDAIKRRIEDSLVGALAVGESIHNAISMVSSYADNSLLCVKSNCKHFTAGERYPYEVDGGFHIIAGDNLVSDLEGEDAYLLDDRGAYFMMTDSHSGGENVAIFKKP